MEQLRVGDESYGFYKLDAAATRLPYTLRILLENVLRNGSEEGAEAVSGWVADADPSREISFHPARVLLQDFTGVPAVVDLAAMRDAMREQGGDPNAINPQIPAELVIDHSVQVDEFASRLAIERNVELEFERNRERYAFLRWGQGAFDNFRVVPPNTGICHQVNLEYLARVVEVRDGVAFPDTLVGTDSHTTMVNGLGVLGWGVGGIEAEAAMLGEALSMLVPQVVGFRLAGVPPGGAPGPRDREPLPPGPAPAEGPRPARAREGGVHGGPRLLRCRPRERAVGQGGRGLVPGGRPADRRRSERRRRAGADGHGNSREETGRGRGRGLRARARLRRDRRDHVLYEHVQPVGDDRGRPARPEGGRARARAAAVGQILPRPWGEGR